MRDDPYVVPGAIQRQIISTLRRALPDEGCGLLFAKGEGRTFYGVRNATPSPGAFSMDPDELLNRMQWAEDHGFSLDAIVHSHVGGRTLPSRDDTAMAAQYPDVVQIIASLHPVSETVHAYRYRSGRLVQVPLLGSYRVLSS